MANDNDNTRDSFDANDADDERDDDLLGEEGDVEDVDDDDDFEDVDPESAPSIAGSGLSHAITDEAGTRIELEDIHGGAIKPTDMGEEMKASSSTRCRSSSREPCPTSVTASSPCTAASCTR